MSSPTGNPDIDHMLLELERAVNRLVNEVRSRLSTALEKMIVGRALIQAGLSLLIEAESEMFINIERVRRMVSHGKGVGNR